jgi:hypothetical protein
MSSLFDDNNEEERQEQKLYEFYEVFSLEVRRQLLAKNIPIIQNVYDVLYPQTKNQLLAKNSPSDLNIDSTAESVRNALVAKMVEDNINIDTISENFRKQLLSKNILSDSSRELKYKIDQVRKNLLSKNKTTNSTDIDSIAKTQREELMSKNKESLNRATELEDGNVSFRENNLTKNSPTENTLDQQSDEFRKNNIHKNVESITDLERQAIIAREQNLAKNKNSISKLDSIADEKRNDNESKNISKDTDGLQIESEEFRNINMSKNVTDLTSLEDRSSDVRDINLSKNDSKDGNLLDDSNKFRKQDLSKNTQTNGDLLSDSQFARDNDLSKNVSKDSDLLTSSEEARLNDISKNKESEGDLLSDSNDIRKDDVSKNTPSTGDLLVDSEDFRGDNLSNNTTKVSDISLDSEVFRNENVSKNVLINTDLETGSEDYRMDDLSRNKPNTSDLLVDSSSLRDDNTSKNVPTIGDLLIDSEPTRDDLLSKTVPNVTDLEVLSQNPRGDLLAQNVPNSSDLLIDGVVPRGDLLSQNVPNPSDLLIDSIPSRNDLLATNVSSITDLLVDSQSTRNDVLSANVPVITDLLNDSIPYYADNISANIPTQYDILTESQPFLNSNLSSNVPNSSDLLSDSYSTLQDNLSPNVPNNSDLLTNSTTFLQDNQVLNVPNTSDLLAESIPIRNDLVSQNQSSNSNLLNDSSIYRDNLVSQNQNTDLGVAFDGIGTFSYLGISKVATQGLVIRTFLKAKNKPNPLMDFDKNNLVVYPDMLMSRNDYVLYKSEYDRSTAVALTNQVDSRGLPLLGYPSAYPDENLTGAISRQIGENTFYTELFGISLQNKYGNLPDNTYMSNKPSEIGGAYFSVDSLNPAGGSFIKLGNTSSAKIYNPIYAGSVTNSIRGYNVSRNLYNLAGIQSVTEMSNYAKDLQSNNDSGFQSLINKTIGSFKTADNSISAQQFGNLIPSSVLGTNNYLYLRMSAEKMMRRSEPTDPSLKMSWVGTPESMMQKTIAGNPLQEPAFNTAQRGVKHIMKTIRNNPNVKMSVNYDPQNTNKYVIGETDPSGVKYSRQRFTIANPYSPPSAKSLLFSLKNYSNGDTLYFPPYVDSFSDSHTANWNEINFLGRPEPIYTYNNSKRDGSISFYVLTDFSQIVLMGRSWDEPDMDKIEKNISASFVKKSKFNTAGGVTDFSGLAEQYGLSKEKIQEHLNFNAAANASTTIATTGQTEATTAGDQTATGANTDNGENAQSNQDIGKLNAENLNLDAAINSFVESADEDFMYTIASEKNKNIYDFMVNDIKRDLDGQIITSPGKTLDRLDAMISGLIFQPSFFSGSKVDFLERMDFLAKLTKPAKASEGSGYSFTSPPVAHIKLGNWWNHDIVVKTVSVDYTDSPWTLDLGRVQPLWAKVTLSFDFVGRFGGEGAPVLSTDSGGVYSY